MGTPASPGSSEIDVVSDHDRGPSLTTSLIAFIRGNAVHAAFILFISIVTASAQDLSVYADRLRNGDVEQKREALFQLRNLRSEAASRIAVTALTDSSDIVRATAASSVVFLPPPDAARALIPLLDDRAPFVRKEAAYSLGAAEANDAVNGLLSVMQRDKDLEVRSAAAAAVGMIGDQAAVPYLIAILKQKPSDDREFLRRSAARSIGQIAQHIRSGSSRVVTPQNFLPEKFKDVDLANAELADSPAFRDAVDVLAKVLSNRSEAPDTRREAAYALGALGDKTVIALLRNFAANPDPFMAEIARESLLRIERPTGN